MAPLSEALSVKHIRSDGHTLTYHGKVDSDWIFAGVPHGGYVLSLLLTACIKHQGTTKHPDPIHLTAHFLLPTTVSEFNVEVEVVRFGSRFTNLLVKWIQEGEARVMTHMIFGILPAFDAPPSDKKYEDIPPTHPLYHSMPLPSHPTTLSVMPNVVSNLGFAKHIQYSPDPVIISRNKSKLVAPRGTHGGGLEGGLWLELTEKGANLALGLIPVFADFYPRTPGLLARTHGDNVPIRTYPTVMLTIEFKRQLPQPGTTGYARRTLGLYSRNHFLDHGRHDGYCEIWTAPSGIGEAEAGFARDENWKQEMRCIAVTGQMALVAPMVLRKSRARQPARL
ncbi:thioesterase family protein [Ceratobasidium sp. AG-Ba]|nr:thioesterase family protein [Ceratobasidium sp. AG-Ba]